jgi:hypothetical protein
MSDRPCHCALEPGKTKGWPLALHRLAHGQRQSHVHGIAQRIADDGVRAVHAPRQAVLRGRCKQPVFLSIVEILDGLAALLFAERRHGHGALAVGVEGSR